MEGRLAWTRTLKSRPNRLAPSVRADSMYSLGMFFTPWMVLSSMGKKAPMKMIMRVEI